MRFLDELAGLSESQWLTVAQRYLAEKKALAIALRSVDHVLADISSGKSKPFGRTEAKWREMVRKANAAMHAVTTHLPGTRDVSGQSVPLREPAYLAVYHAISALKVFAELDHSPDGRGVLLRLLGPFDGMTTSIVA